MKNCKQLIEKIRGEEEFHNEALKEMYNDPHFRRSAVYWYKKYPKLHDIFGWEDILSECICRFFIRARDKEKKPINNCKAFFHRICEFYCQESTRKYKKRIPDEFRPPVSTPGDLPEGIDKDKFMEAVKPYVDKLSPQCKLLMQIIYFYQPPIDTKEREKIARILKGYGYDLKVSSIPATITRCKSNLRKSVLEDIENFEGFDLDGY